MYADTTANKLYKLNFPSSEEFTFISPQGVTNSANIPSATNSKFLQ